MSVRFTDDAGISDGAMDEGGQRCEFLQLLINHLEESPLFIGPSHAKNLHCLSAGVYVLAANFDLPYRDLTMPVNTGH